MNIRGIKGKVVKNWLVSPTPECLAGVEGSAGSVA